MTEGRRKRKRKLKRKYRNRRIMLAVVLIALIGGGCILFSSLTATQGVAISGTKKIPKTTIRQIADDYVNKSYLTMDRKSLKNRLEQLPYVKSADIGISFPHTLTIAIEEETPSAQLYSGDGYILVNEDFKALAKTRSYDTDLPKITGIPTSGIKLGQVAFRETGNEKKIAMIRALFRSEIKKDINTLAILDRGVKISFSDGTIVHIGSFNDADYKVKQLEEIRKEMKTKDESYREIFLDQGDHPIAVKPSSMDEDEGEPDGEHDNARSDSPKDDKDDKGEKSTKSEKSSKKPSQKAEGSSDSKKEKSTDKEEKTR